MKRALYVKALGLWVDSIPGYGTDSIGDGMYSRLALVKKLLTSGAGSIRFETGDLFLLAGSASKERLSHLDVARHSDTRVSLQSFSEQSLRCLAITWSGAIH